jgi:hypothetical protein
MIETKKLSKPRRYLYGRALPSSKSWQMSYKTLDYAKADLREKAIRMNAKLAASVWTMLISEVHLQIKERAGGMDNHL